MFPLPLVLALGLVAAAMAADADGDGQAGDRDGLLRDCDDTDPAVFVGAFEVAADGVDSDCDGADNPVITRPSTCPTFSTPAEAYAWVKDPWLGTFDAVDVVVDTLNAIPGRDCADAATVDTGVVVGGFADCDDGDVEWETGRWTAAFLFDPPTSDGVVGASVRFTYESWEDNRYVSGALDWSDGTSSEVWATTVDASYWGGDSYLNHTSTAWNIDGCELYVREWDGYSNEVWSEGWTVETPEHTVIVSTFTAPYDCSPWLATVDGVNAGAIGSRGEVLSSPDADLDGWTEDTDCNDLDPAINRCAKEIANDGIDQDCTGEDYQTDDDGDGIYDMDDCEPYDAALPAWTHTDVDADGFGVDPVELTCAPAAGASFASGDCDDTQPTVYPDAPEHCDGLDNDCDGLTDWNAEEETLWYPDHDGDGHGSEDSGPPEWACDQPEGMAPGSDDCQDADPGRFPGAAEVPGDGIDQDCDGEDPAAAPVEAGCFDACGLGAAGMPLLLLLPRRRRPPRGDRAPPP